MDPFDFDCWLLFIAVAKRTLEVLFRGYIQTRLFGLINSQWIVGIINSVLFASCPKRKKR